MTPTINNHHDLNKANLHEMTVITQIFMDAFVTGSSLHLSCLVQCIIIMAIIMAIIMFTA